MLGTTNINDREIKLGCFKRTPPPLRPVIDARREQHGSTGADADLSTIGGRSRNLVRKTPFLVEPLCTKTRLPKPRFEQLPRQALDKRRKRLRQRYIFLLLRQGVVAAAGARRADAARGLPRRQEGRDRYHLSTTGVCDKTVHVLVHVCTISK